MAKSSGQDSAPRADICTASVQDASPPNCQIGIALCGVLIQYLCVEHPLTDYQVASLTSDWCSARRRKRMLLALHARGLVTDEQVERAFAQHPELVGA